MYPFILQTHSILRYAVLLMLVVVIVRFIFAKLFPRQYNATDERLNLVTLMLVHLQFLIGLILYLVSPITREAMNNMAAAMKDETLRFWAVEHFTIMVIAVIIITVGRIRTRKNGLRSEEKFRRLIIFYSIGLVLIIAGIPWERLLPF